MSNDQPQSLGAAAVRSFHPPVELNWQRLNLVGGAMAAIGILGFVVALGLGEDNRVWEAYLVSFVFFIGVAQGGVLLSCGFYLVHGRWTRNAVHMRVAEAGWPFLVLAPLLFWGIFLGRDHLFPWIAHPIAKQAAWLNASFMFSRDFAALAIMAVLSFFFVRISRGRKALEWATDPNSIEMPPVAIRRLAPVLGVLYIYLYSILAWDLIMSLSPRWHSTLFGWWWFEMCFWSAIAAAAFVAANFRTLLGPDSAFANETVTHDFGKLVFAFSIFWIYLSFAQYLVIWYADLPTETFFDLLYRGPLLALALAVRRLALPGAGLGYAIFHPDGCAAQEKSCDFADGRATRTDRSLADQLCDDRAVAIAEQSAPAMGRSEYCRRIFGTLPALRDAGIEARRAAGDPRR